LASSNQLEIWLACEMSDEPSLYNVYRTYRFAGVEPLERIRDAVHILAARHAAFRSAFSFERDRLMRRDGGHRVPVIEAALRPGPLAEQLLALAEEPFPLDGGPLARWYVLVGEACVVVLFTAHHIVCDGRSVELIFEEFSALYHGQSLPHVPDETIEAGPAAVAGPPRARRVEPWLRWSAEALALEDPAGDAPRDAGTVLARDVPLSLSVLHDAARHEHASLFSLLLAALYVALRAYGAPDRFGIAVPYAGQRAIAGDARVGNFVESLHAIVETPPAPTLSACIAVSRDAVLDAIERREADGHAASRADVDFVPNVSLNLYERAGAPRSIAEAEEIVLPVRTAKYDLTLGAAIDDDRLRLLFSYRTSVISARWVTELADRTLAVLCAIPDSSSQSIEPWLRADVRASAVPASLVSTVAEAWRDVLRVPHVGPDDDFLEIGGYSLLAAQIAARLTADLGRPVTLRDLFAASTPRALAQRITSRGSVPSREPFDLGADSLPITRQQSRIWYYSRSLPEEIHLTVASAVRFEEHVNRSALAAAFTWVQRRHGALRTHFVNTPHGIAQAIDASPAVEIDFRDEVADDAAVTDAIEQLHWTPFDLAQVPLRACAIPIASGGTCFVVSMHHSITDGWSMQIFFDDLATAYRAACAGEPMPGGSPAQYAGFAREKATEDRTVGTARLAYWRHALRGARPPAIPTDFPRESWSFSGTTYRFSVPAAARNAAALTARALQVSPAAYFVAAYCNALFELSGSDDLLIMLIDANRSDARYADCVGFFTNIVPLRVRREPGAAELVRAVADEMLGAFAHADVRLGDVLDLVRGQEDYRDYMRVGFDFFAGHREPPDFGTASSTFPIPHDIAKYDFNLGLVYGKNGPVDVLLHHRTDLFRLTTVQAFSAHYADALERLGDDIRARL
jgi:hypothetical protein